MIYKIIYFKIKHLTLEKKILFCYNCINENNNSIIFYPEAWAALLVCATIKAVVVMLKTNHRFF